LCQKRKTSGKFSQMSKKHPHSRKIRNKYLGFYRTNEKKNFYHYLTMKQSFTFLLLCFALAFMAAESDPRSLFLRNFLCLPLFDDCNRNSELFSDGIMGDTCLDGRGICVKAVEGGVVCVTERQGDGDSCSRSRDCSGKYVFFATLGHFLGPAAVSLLTNFASFSSRVCIDFDGGLCATQIRRSD
jgi:hypothetical protein